MVAVALSGGDLLVWRAAHSIGACSGFLRGSQALALAFGAGGGILQVLHGLDDTTRVEVTDVGAADAEEGLGVLNEAVQVD